MPPKKKASRPIPGGARKRRGGFPCPDCDFVAKHAMGLGRHRSARHGVVSGRQRRSGAGAWITREQAAREAGVHYNTIRQWEQAGLLRMVKQSGTRGALVSAADLGRIVAERAGGARDAEAIAALEARFTLLVDGLERALASIRTAPESRRRAPKRPRPRGRR